jgi:hypothetical protein
MILDLTDKETVELTASFDTNGLVLAYSGTPLSWYDHIIFNELVLLTATSITVADFMQDQVQYRVHAWELVSSVPRHRWSRPGNHVSSGPRTELNTEVLFIAAPEGVTPEPTSSQGPPPPGTSQTVLKVKVRKQGSMPGD